MCICSPLWDSGSKQHVDMNLFGFSPSRLDLMERVADRDLEGACTAPRIEQVWTGMEGGPGDCICNGQQHTQEETSSPW